MAAIGYLQSRLFIHAAIAVARSPARLALWIVNLVVIIAIAILWINAPEDGGSRFSLHYAGAFIVTACCLGLAAECLSGIGSPRMLGVGEDDLILIGLGIDQRAELLRQRLSNIAAAAMTYGFRLSPVGIFFLPHGPAALPLLRCFALAASVALLLMVAPLAWSMWKPIYGNAIAVGGIVLAAIGVASAASLYVPSLHVVYALCAELGDVEHAYVAPLLLISFLGSAAACALTLRGPLASLDRAFVPGDARDSAIVIIADASTEAEPRFSRMTGAWTEVWRLRTIELRQGAQRYFAAGILVALASGVALGAAARVANPQVVWFCGFLFANGLIVFSASHATRLSFDLAQPLWWLSADSPALRLSVRIVHDLFAQVAVVATFVSGYFALLAPADVPLAIIFTLAFIVLTTAISALVYVTFPARADTRGPAWLLRIATTYAFLTFSAFLPSLLIVNAPSNVAACLAACILLMEAVALYALFVRSVLTRPERLMV